MTGEDLVNEIADLLEEDFSLNPLWSQATLFNYLTETLPEVVKSSGGMDVQVSNLALTALSTGTTCTLTTGVSLMGLWHVRTTSAAYPIIDIQESELLLGRPDPYTNAGGTQACLLEGKTENSSGVSVHQHQLRFIPGFASGTTITYYAITAPPTSQTLASELNIREIFLPPLKYTCLSRALMSETEGRDPERAEVWKGLSGILTNAIKTLYRGGELL
jgi:hypothetical protein